MFKRAGLAINLGRVPPPSVDKLNEKGSAGNQRDYCESVLFFPFTYLQTDPTGSS